MYILIMLLQSEYIAECDKRRHWISGFTGSAGNKDPSNETSDFFLTLF